NLLDIRADVIGDHIVVVLVDLRIHHPESDAIYLVDWKRGRTTLVHRLQMERMKARSPCSQKT
ncbi:hypothetical protein BGY98DRAFT_1021292, partial [Russula aff. rugulosa BPL654]